MNNKSNPISHKFKDVFISYGRRESLGFVGRLHQQLKLKGYDCWFDKVNIPDGDDYTQRINHGIESAHNFIYIMTPRSLTSPYCLIELEYARVLGKRVIPINQMVVNETVAVPLSYEEKVALEYFYWEHRLLDSSIQNTQEVLVRSLDLIGSTDWLDAKEQLTDTDCDDLSGWAKRYENHWHRHEDIEFLQNLQLPTFGNSIDTFESAVERVITVLERENKYISKHTQLLDRAINWVKNQKQTVDLLVGEERKAAEEWLLQPFTGGRQIPCRPSDLLCEFICESRKNSENLMTDVFICYSTLNSEQRNEVVKIISQYGVTTWNHDKDIRKGEDHQAAILRGIEEADNFIFFISPNSVESEHCQREYRHAIKHNKRIIPLLIATTDIQLGSYGLFEGLAAMQYIDFTDNRKASDYEQDIDEILTILKRDKQYHLEHKQLLTKAIKWKRQSMKPVFLLRGFNLDNAQTWYRINEDRRQYSPTALHHEFIAASEAAKGSLSTEVFISYSRKDSDFARKLNNALQEAGKTTWFDQESIASSADFQTEIYKGIQTADNLMFIISPDSINSPYCQDEVSFAAAQNKRFISVLYKTPHRVLPKELEKINWLDFEKSDFDLCFKELIQTLELDREYAHMHTVLQQRAIEWEENDKSEDFLLNASACDNAESWLDKSINKSPIPTPLQGDFIINSRKAINDKIKKINKRKVKEIISILFLALLIIAVFTISFQYFQSRYKEIEASEKAALNYAYKGIEILNNEHDPKRALSMIKEAINIVNEESAHKLIPFVRDISMSLNYIDMRHEEAVKGVDFLSDITDRQLLSFTQKKVKIWNLDGDLIYMISSDDIISEAGFSPNKKNVYIITNNKVINLIDLNAIKTQDEENDFIQISLSSNKFVRKISANDHIVSYKFFDGGNRLLVIYRSIAARVWTSKGYFAGAFNHNGRINGGVISEDENLLLTYSNDNTARFWSLKKSDSDKFLSILRYHNAPIISADIATDNSKVLTLDKAGKASIWDLSNKRAPRLIKSYNGVTQITFTKNPNIVLVKWGSKKIRIENINGDFYAGLITDKQFDLGVDSVLFTKDKEKILTYSRYGSAALWGLNGQLIFECDIYDKGFLINLIKLSYEGNYLLVSDEEGGITVWSTKTGNEIANLKAFKGEISDVEFFPDNKKLIVASVDMTAKYWHFTENLFDSIITNDVEPEEFMRTLNNWLNSVGVDSVKMAAKDIITINLIDDFSRIFNSQDSAELYAFSDYFKKKGESISDGKGETDNYNKALSLYSKINDILPYRSIYSEIAEVDILFELNNIDNFEFDSFFTPSSLREHLYLAQYITQKWSSLKPLERIEAYSYTFDLYDKVRDSIAQKKYVVSEERSMSINRRMSDNCNSLAYYHLLSGELNESIRYAEKGMSIDSTYKWIKTKLALAHLYNGDFEKAVPLLEEMQGRKYGIDEYEMGMRRYIQKIDSTWKSNSQDELSVPLSLPEIIKVFESQLSSYQIGLLNKFMPKQ